MKKTIYTDEHRLLVKKLVEARLKAGLNQEDVAKRLGKTQSYVSKFESGQRRIDLVQLRTLATLYKKPLSHFLP